MPYFNYGQLYGMTKVTGLEYYGSGSVNQTTVSATQKKKIFCPSIILFYHLGPFTFCHYENSIKYQFSFSSLESIIPKGC